MGEDALVMIVLIHITWKCLETYHSRNDETKLILICPPFYVKFEPFRSLYIIYVW